MDFYTALFELIDLRSFSNLWYWIMLAIFWSTASHFVLGVPYDMITRAVRQGGQAAEDVVALAGINARRLIYIADTAGGALTVIGCFLLAALATSGFWYGVEFTQALFLIVAPLSLVLLLSISTARRIDGLDFAALRVRLRNHRIIIQIIGMLSILVTSMWGMYVNISTGVLGG